MIAYSVVMFAAAVVMIILGIMVYRGKTELIHAYHQTRVKDKRAYGRAMGKVLIGVSVPLTGTGIAALFSTSFLPTVILLVGMIISFIPLFVVQKKYNGGLF